MPRIKIDLPADLPFNTLIPVRITDLNYGGHVGNDTILSIIHEARMQFLSHYGYTEMDFGGAGMIMSDVTIEFKRELFYGDNIQVAVAIADISKVAFAFYYRLQKEVNKQTFLTAVAKTGMVCYNYETKKIASVPEQVKRMFIR